MDHVLNKVISCDLDACTTEFHLCSSNFLDNWNACLFQSLTQQELSGKPSKRAVTRRPSASNQGCLAWHATSHSAMQGGAGQSGQSGHAGFSDPSPWHNHGTGTTVCYWVSLRLESTWETPWTDGRFFEGRFLHRHVWPHRFISINVRIYTMQNIRNIDVSAKPFMFPFIRCHRCFANPTELWTRPQMLWWQPEEPEIRRLIAQSCGKAKS